MRLLNLAFFGLLFSRVAAAAIPGFTPLQLRQAILNGTRLPEMILEVEKLPPLQQLPRLIEALELKFPADTEVVHFANMQWFEGNDERLAFNSMITQVEFLKWHAQNPMNILWDEIYFDVNGEPDRANAELFAGTRRNMTPPGLFDRTVKPEQRADTEDLYVRGAPGVLYNERHVPSIFAGASLYVQKFSLDQDRQDDLVLFDLHEIAAVLRIERLLELAPHIHQSVVLLSRADHAYEAKFSGIPNFKFSTVLRGPAEEAFKSHRAMQSIKRQILQCDAELGGGKFKIVTM